MGLGAPRTHLSNYSRRTTVDCHMALPGWHCPMGSKMQCIRSKTKFTSHPIMQCCWLFSCRVRFVSPLGCSAWVSYQMIAPPSSVRARCPVWGRKTTSTILPSSFRAGRQKTVKTIMLCWYHFRQHSSVKIFLAASSALSICKVSTQPFHFTPQ